MKKLFVFVTLSLIILNAMFAQVGINSDNSAPNPSAGLDVKFSNKGFLPPRMTHLELNGISNPPNGLVVFCTDCGVNSIGALVVVVTGKWQILSTGCLNPVSPIAGTHVPSTTQIVWNWYPVADATGYKWNTTNNFSTAIDMGTVTTKTETGLNCLAPYTRFVWAYSSCGNSIPSALYQTTLYCAFNCGSSLIVNHVIGVAAPVNKAVTYGTVNNIPGEPAKCWITSNLGADHQATNVDDVTEASAGWYWQFNRMQGYKHDGINRTPNTSWILNINEISDWIMDNDPCNIELGNSWRIPTKTEWINLGNSGGWTNWNGPWNSPLKLHSAGDLNNTDGTLNNRGSYGYYWSNTQFNATTAWDMTFNSGSNFFYNDEKSFSLAIRCIREN
jgi:hypothetical protein